METHFIIMQSNVSMSVSAVTCIIHSMFSQEKRLQYNAAM